MTLDAKMSKAELLQYVRGVARSIEENIERLKDHDEKVMKRIADGIQTFYVSLFDRKGGVFQSDNIDENLTRAVAEIAETSNSPPISSPKRKRAMPRVGAGKGSPLKPRKVHVSKRQQRVRTRRGFDLSGFGRELQVADRSQETNEPSTSNAGDEQRSMSSTSPPQTPPPAQETPASSPVQRTPSPTASLQSTAATAAPALIRDDDRPLRVQVRNDSQGRGGVQRFQLLAAMSQDQCETSSTGSNFSDQPSDDELGLFAREIEHWNRVDARVEYALRDTWYEISHNTTPDPDDSEFLETLVAAHNMSNAVANSMAHLKGYLVQLCQQRESSGNKEVEVIREEIHENLQAAEYSEYISLLRRCACQECVDVTDFDDAYNRCREKGSRQRQLGDRPIHCISVDSSVRAVRAKYKGLSASSLQKCHYFYLSTPKFSPPTLATAIPTTVQALTTAYMKRHAKSVDVAEPYPKSWYANYLPFDVANATIVVPKENVHLFDGDGGEITVGDEDSRLLKALCTHPGTIRFRFPLCDAPEIRTAFRFKRRRGDLLTSLGTVDVGIEAMRMARKLLFSATEVSLLVRTSDSDEGPVPTAELDSPHYRRVLCDVLVKRGLETDENKWVFLSQLLAEEGYLFPCFRFGIEERIKDGMDVARADRKGMFRLPDESRQPGFLPWDIKDGQTVSEPVLIRNVGSKQPEVLWFGKEATEQTGDGNDRYYVELTESREWLEASCFVKTSTIPGAGRGLFLKPHQPIPKGQFVCLYANLPTTQQAMDAAGSSGDYALLTGRAKRWFDAENQDGVCLGRFANQLHVRESLDEVSRRSRKTLFTEMREEDWKQMNDADAQRATVVYEQRKDQLVLVTAKELPRADEAHELFAHYGDLRQYWLPLIRRKPDSFPNNMSSVVNWLLHSDECNWSQQQKQDWLGLNNG